MKSCRTLIFTGLFLLLVSGAKAEEGAERKPLPPEKTQVIYDTLLPKEGAEPGGAETESEKAPPVSVAGMTTEKMAQALRARGIEVRGELLRRQFVYAGAQFFLLAEPRQNRMRLLSPLARLDSLRRDPDFNEVELLQELLKANYLATGNARFCVNRNIIWAAFMHPLDTLTERDLMSALDQLADTARKVHADAD
jgi:hypothetical protein